MRKEGRDKLINIGDFYGDPQIALISEDEKYCVIGGAGIIIYYLTEPFENYKYSTQSEQWKEWGRETANGTVWVDNITAINEKVIEVETEDKQKVILAVY